MTTASNNLRPAPSARSGERAPRLAGRYGRLSAAGLCGALVVLVFLVGNATTLILGEKPPAVTMLTPPEPGAPPPERALLVIIDAMRDDASRDPALMPTMVALRQTSGHGILRVDALLPSTVAGIRALVTGLPAPPLSIFEDFGAANAGAGGLFAAARAAGKRSFVTGPSLWVELYGRWIDDSVTDTKLAGDDEAYLAAGLRALAEHRHQLLVVHLGQCDETAHRFGGRSPEYRQSLRWSDAALAQLLRAAGPGTAVVVATDHGVTSVGGHTALERTVRITPFVVLGPRFPRGELGTLAQTDVPSLLLQALGTKLPAAAPAADGPDALTFTLCLLIALLAALRGWGALALGHVATREAAWLALGVAAVLVVAASGFYAAAAWTAAAALSTTALWQRTSALRAPLFVFAVGVGFGALRLWDGFAHADDLTELPLGAALAALAPATLLVALPAGLLGRSWRTVQARLLVAWRAFRGRWGVLACAAIVLGTGQLLGGLALTGVAAGAIGTGALLGTLLGGRPARALWVGAACLFFATSLARLLGETASLSSTDVRVAYTLVDGPLGLTLAAFTYAFRMALPAWALCVGLAPWLARASAANLGSFAVGAAAALVGQTLPAALLLTAPADPIWVSLAVSTALRAGGELAFLFVGVAAAMAATGVRQPRAKASRLPR